MPLLRDLARAASNDVDSRLKAEQAARPDPAQELLEQRATDLLDDWLAAEATRQTALGQRPLNRADEAEIRTLVMRRLFGLGDLEPLLQDADVETIYIDGFDKVYVDTTSRGICDVSFPIADSDEHLVELIQRIAARDGIEERSWDSARPVLDAPLRSGDRLNGVLGLGETARGAQPLVTIRLHHSRVFSPEEMVRARIIDERADAFFRAAFLASQSLMLGGATGAGKSTLMRSFIAAYVPRDVRIITVEDTLELYVHKLGTHPYCVALQTRNANVEGRGAITTHDLYKSTLRMKPGLLVNGEVRDPEQVMPTLHATAAGDAAGSISSIHARSARQVISRLQSLALEGPGHVPYAACAAEISQGIDFILHMHADSDKDGHKHRQITEIIEVGRSLRAGEIVLNQIMELNELGYPTWPEPLSEERRDLLARYGYDQAQWARHSVEVYP